MTSQKKHPVVPWLEMASKSVAEATALSSLAALYRERGEADFTITCQNQVLKAHSWVLSMGSDFFKTALTTKLHQEQRKTMEVVDGTPDTLAVIVAYMYGMDILEGFKDLVGLLHLADMFLMEELREEAGRRLALGLDHHNHLELCRLADRYRVQGLAASAATFLLTEVRAVEWEQVGRLGLVMAAMARQGWAAMDKLKAGRVHSYMKRDDFVEHEAYSEYVRSELEEGTVVRWLGAHQDTGTVTVVSQDLFGISWTKYGFVTYDSEVYWKLELVSPPLHSLFQPK